MTELIVNELSFQCWDDPQGGHACRDRHHARELMAQLVDTVREASRFPSIAKGLRTEYGAFEYPLADSYTVAQWRNDPEVNRDARVFLKQRAAIRFYLPDTLGPLEERAAISDVSICGRSGAGLCAAWILDGITLSLASHDTWGASSLAVDIISLYDGDDSGKKTQTLRHVSEPAHFREHAARLMAADRASIRNGRILLESAPALYPAIEVGTGARETIGALNGKEKYFDWVVECFECANREMLAWTRGRFPHDKLPGPATGESRPVRDSRRLMDLRKFPLPSGRVEQFEYHMKNIAENARIYYRAETDRRTVVIGALTTEHLESAKC